MLADNIDPTWASSNERRTLVSIRFFEDINQMGPSLLLSFEGSRRIESSDTTRNGHIFIHGSMGHTEGTRRRRIYRVSSENTGEQLINYFNQHLLYIKNGK